MEIENQELQVFYPYQILYEFVKKAIKHTSENGSQKQLMAVVIGYKKGNKLIGNELVFPDQTCPHSNVTELGKESFGIDYVHSVDWLINNTLTGRLHKENSTVLCWIHSHIDSKPSYLSSIDLHYHHILQKTFPDIQALVVDICGQTFVTHKFYTLSEHGKQQLARCLKKTHTFHASCTGEEFYQIADCHGYDLPFIYVVDLKSTIEYHDTSIPNLDGQYDFPNVQLIYPKDMIERFTDVAVSQAFKSGRIECLAYLAGYKEGNTLIGTHLIFPRQTGTSTDVEDLGVNQDRYDTMRWILFNSDIAKNHGQNATILAWIHTHVESNQCDFLSSIDVHNQRVLERSFPHIKAIVVELNRTDKVDQKFYELTPNGRRICNKLGFHPECKNKRYYRELTDVDESGENIVQIYNYSIGPGFQSIDLDYQYSIQMEDNQIENEKVAKDSTQENPSVESAKDESMSSDDNEPGPSFAAGKKRQKRPLSSSDDEILSFLFSVSFLG